MKHFLIIVITLIPFVHLFAQQESVDVRRGNRAYNNEEYTAAEINYRRGLEKNSNSFEAHYNLGAALFRQDKYQDAVNEFQRAESITKNDTTLSEEEYNERLAATYHNMGDAYYMQQEYGKAVDAFQKALKHNPKDDESRYNLVKAKEKQKQHPPQQQQQQQKQEQQQQQNDSTQQQQQPLPPPQQQDQMDKETAEQILQALEQDEQDTQDKIQIRQSKKSSLEKNW
jgi:tetratricopeptide (TPR) repeat protein